MSTSGYMVFATRLLLLINLQVIAGCSIPIAAYTSSTAESGKKIAIVDCDDNPILQDGYLLMIRHHNYPWSKYNRKYADLLEVKKGEVVLAPKQLVKTKWIGFYFLMGFSTHVAPTEKVAFVPLIEGFYSQQNSPAAFTQYPKTLRVSDFRQRIERGRLTIFQSVEDFCSAQSYWRAFLQRIESPNFQGEEICKHDRDFVSNWVQQELTQLQSDASSTGPTRVASPSPD